jgi:shikimate kinase
LESRIQDYSTRGLAKRPDQTFSDLFLERCSLYTKWADLTIKNDSLTHENVCKILMQNIICLQI